MEKQLMGFHVLTVTILSLILIIITFSTDNPTILFGIFIFFSITFIGNKNEKELLKGLIYFFPMAVVTIAINMIFTWEGKTLLFSILGKRFTLEAFLYSSILSFKLLLIIYIFMLLNLMIDSDNAVSYFSSKLPKSTLILMIGFKLLPNMRSRLKNLKEIYSIRGVEFETKTLRDKLKSYIPILSIILESSLESSFDIGEAAYVKGFLSGRRTIYDRQKLDDKDFSLIITSVVTIFLYIVFLFKGLLVFDVYSTLNIDILLNLYSLIVFITFILLAIIIMVFKEKKDVLYRD